MNLTLRFCKVGEEGDGESCFFVRSNDYGNCSLMAFYDDGSEHICYQGQEDLALAIRVTPDIRPDMLFFLGPSVQFLLSSYDYGCAMRMGTPIFL